MKCTLRFWLSLVVTLCCLSQAIAQNIRIKGTVRNKTTGEALPNASVSIKGSTQATVTDQSGNYTLQLPEKGAVIVVSYIGMTSVERRLTANSDANFVLEESAATNLTDVVVVGYGTQKITKVSQCG